MRRRLGIAVDTHLVVGWADDPTPADLRSFVGVLAAVESGQKPTPSGLWLGGPPDALRVMEAEAKRADFEVVLHHRAETSVDARLCGDVLFIPVSSRSTAQVREALVTGLTSVSYTPCGLDDPGHVVVPPSPNSIAVAAVTEALARTRDRDKRAALAAEHYDVRPWVDRFLPEVHQLANRPRRPIRPA